MRLILLTCVVLVAFAANSVLTRLGVARFGTDPETFALVRTAAGVAVLWALVLARRGGWPGGGIARRLGGAATLAAYMAGFSLAYLTLDTGVGALILFGGVQITMFAGALAGGEAVTRRRALGAAIALAGLGALVWPTEAVVLPVAGVVLMIVAAVGWGIYSLLGRGERDPLSATAANFLLCLPMLVPLLLWGERTWTAAGFGLALLAGGLTSGLGYALWYGVVPRLGAGRAAVAQLSVPVIAAAGGVVLLGEPVTWRFALCAAVVLGGIAVSLSSGGALR